MLSKNELERIVLHWLKTDIPQDFLTTLQENLQGEMPREVGKLLSDGNIAYGDIPSFKGYLQHFFNRNIFQRASENFGQLKQKAGPSDIPLLQFNDILLSIVRIGPYDTKANDSKKRNERASKNNITISFEQESFTFMNEKGELEDCLTKIKENSFELFALIEARYTKRRSVPSIYLSIPYLKGDRYLCCFHLEEIIESYSTLSDDGKQPDKATPGLKKQVSEIQKDKDGR